MKPTLLYFLLLCTSGVFGQDLNLDWFTYFGGDGNSMGFHETIISNDGSIYLAGRVENEDLVFGDNIHQNFYAGNIDSFLARFTPDGDLLWSTYFGGSQADLFNSLSLTSDGHPIIAGSTSSPDGIVFGSAFQTELIGNGDSFIAVFNDDGTLLWSTYFGGSETDANVQINCSSNGKVYLSGRTYSEGLSTPGAHQELHSNPSSLDGFITQFDEQGTLIWSTYYGLNGDDYIADASVNENGEIFILLNTDSNIGFSSDNAFLTEGEGISPVLAKFSPTGSLIWATYLPGEGDETSTLIEASQPNSIYIVGMSTSLSGISTSDAFQSENIPGNTWPGGASAFILKFNGNGSLEWGSYFGGLYSTWIDDIAAADDGIIFIGDSPFSEGYIFGDQPFQTELNGIRDLVVTKFSNLGQPIWSTVFGGTGSESNGRISYRNEKIALLGNTTSEDFYQNEASWQNEFGGGLNDYFLAFFEDNTVSNINIFREASRITLYPNPSKEGIIKLNWQSKMNENPDLTIYNSLGEQMVQIKDYRRTQPVEVNLPNGWYSLTLISEAFNYSEQFLLLR